MKYNKITISGRICTGKSTLFADLSKELQWKTFSTSKHFRDLAKKQKKSINKAEEQNDKITKEVDFMVRDMLQTDQNLIAEGWMTGIMAERVDDAFKVLLKCPDDKRVARYAKRESVSTSKAQQEINGREENLLSVLSNIYSIDDIFDTNRYNIVIDTSKKTPDGVLQEVLSHITS